MRKLTEYPILSLAERDRRWALTRAEMKRRNLDCLVLFGWPVLIVVGLGIVERWIELRRRDAVSGPDRENL